ncbi:hypothetical protein V1264_005205 [Littorina saxatilis]|uniref:Uncharacterized protein n=1 Tax=Littorina saxatilis TaxID=31220 RepID=A0AAN9AYR1_9CAEN
MKSSALLCVFLAIAFIMATTHGWSGHVCTRTVCYRTHRVCRYRWWGSCASYKTSRRSYNCNQKYCCPGWRDMGNGNCTMRIGSKD